MSFFEALRKVTEVSVEVCWLRQRRSVWITVGHGVENGNRSDKERGHGPSSRNLAQRSLANSQWIFFFCNHSCDANGMICQMKHVIDQQILSKGCERTLGSFAQVSPEPTDPRAMYSEGNYFSFPEPSNSFRSEGWSVPWPDFSDRPVSATESCFSKLQYFILVCILKIMLKFYQT